MHERGEVAGLFRKRKEDVFLANRVSGLTEACRSLLLFSFHANAYSQKC